MSNPKAPDLAHLLEGLEEQMNEYRAKPEWNDRYGGGAGKSLNNLYGN